MIERAPGWSRTVTPTPRRGDLWCGHLSSGGIWTTTKTTVSLREADRSPCPPRTNARERLAASGEHPEEYEDGENRRRLLRWKTRPQGAAEVVSISCLSLSSGGRMTRRAGGRGGSDDAPRRLKLGHERVLRFDATEETDRVIRQVQIRRPVRVPSRSSMMPQRWVGFFRGLGRRRTSDQHEVLRRIEFRPRLTPGGARRRSSEDTRS